MQKRIKLIRFRMSKIISSGNRYSSDTPTWDTHPRGTVGHFWKVQKTHLRGTHTYMGQLAENDEIFTPTWDSKEKIHFKSR